MNFHIEHARRMRVATPCTAHHMTFEGKCLNCGYDPSGDIDKLRKLIATHTKKLIAQAKQKGMCENFGEKEGREVDEVALSIAHSGRAKDKDRRMAGALSMGFFDWRTKYNG